MCERGHTWMARPNNRMGGSDCPTCVKGVSALEARPGLELEWAPSNRVPVALVSHQSALKADWVCEKGHSWGARVYDRVRGRGCPECSARSYVSSGEKEVQAFLAGLGVRFEASNRKLLKGREVDVLIPELKTAIEFNGLYWHSEDKLGRGYHKEKTDALANLGYQLIHVWEDDWRYRRGAVERMIARKLGVSRESRLNARSLDTADIPAREARQFLDEFHIQGFSAGGTYLALKDSEVRAVLVMKKRREGEFELVRFATSAIVRGGHSKLLKAFLTERPEARRIVTFADRGVSDGGLYETCGFVPEGELPPDYMYVVRGRREHKFNYRKSRFKKDPAMKYEEGMSERELASLNNLPRIYDSGKVRYVWTR